MTGSGSMQTLVTSGSRAVLLLHQLDLAPRLLLLAPPLHVEPWRPAGLLVGQDGTDHVGQSVLTRHFLLEKLAVHGLAPE